MPRPLIGLCWQLGAKSPFAADPRSRGMALDELRPLAGSGVSLVSLQVPPPATDRATMEDVGIIDVSDGIRDFADTAVLIAALDLVVTVDTAVAHCAGAISQALWVMLPQPANWQ